MANKKPRVAIVTNVIANYRADFYRRIFENESFDITVFCQPSIPGMNLKTVHDQFADKVILVKSWGLAKEKLAWQFLPFWRLYKNYDVLFFYGNPRVLSNVAYSILYKLLGKKVVIWGQAHTAGANPKLEKIRLAWWRLFDYLFLYTDKEIDYLKSQGFRTQNMLGMNNGLNQEDIDAAKVQWPKRRLEEWQSQQDIENKTIILSCARLEPKNQFDLMIPVLKQLSQTNPQILWCVIGQGEQGSRLQAAVEQAGLTRHVRWLGAIYQECELAPWFLSSKILVHPGAIGLSLLHAFGYGLPVITHDDMHKQMPEIAAFENNGNGLLFNAGDAASLGETLRTLLIDPATLGRLSQTAQQTAKCQFNTRIMAQRFLQMASNTDSRFSGTDKEISA